MPKHEQFILVANKSIPEIMAIAYNTFTKLNLDIAFSTEDKIIGYTSGASGQEIIAHIKQNEINVSSELKDNALVDFMGKNKKNVKAFIDTFYNEEKELNNENVNSITDKLAEIQNKTLLQIAKEEAEALEIDKALNLSGSNLYVTYAIIAINFIIFGLMVLDGAGFLDVNGYVHLKWGSNYGPLTTSGDWWRLISCIFIHFGIIHVAMNMYCLYTVGIYLEPLLGKVKYTLAYLCTGVCASLVSLWWHSEPANSAGASGAVFGMYGVFLALLVSNIIPKSVRDAQLKSIGIFVAYNLLYGMKSGVDNAAHVGGLISGFGFGYLLGLVIKAERNEQKLNWAVPLIAAITIGASVFYLDSNKTDSSQRNKILSEINNANFKDNDAFNTKYDEVIEKQNLALAVYDDSTLTDITRKEKLLQYALPLWNEATLITNKLVQLNVDTNRINKAKSLQKYISLRTIEISIANKILDGDITAKKQRDSLIVQINTVVENLK
jgi:rhomboid protease GluP